MCFYSFLIADAGRIDVAVAIFLGLVAVIIVAAVIYGIKNRPPESEEPAIQSLNTLAAMPPRREEVDIFASSRVVYKTTIRCPRCKAYLGDTVADMRHWCPNCQKYIAPPKTG